MSRFRSSVNQKGAVGLLVIILVVGIGLIAGLYLISQNTSWFSFAGSNSSQITIPVTPPSSKASPVAVSSPSVVYENPFDQSSSYENPFEEKYENPFNSL